MSQWSFYNLKENPFPQAASIDPFSQDPRGNGTIFQPSLLEKKVAELSEKIAAKMNLIYIMGLVHERGTGKSALLVNQYRKLLEMERKGEKVRTCYIRCTKKDKPESFCSKILEEWHNNGFLWAIFKKLLLEFSKATSSLSITQASVEVMFRKYSSPPDQVNLKRYFHISKLSPIARKIQDYINRSYGINKEVVKAFVESYLSTPTKLLKSLNPRRFHNVDQIDIFGEILRLTSILGGVYHYIFVDQLEDRIAVLSDREIVKFTLSMRRILEKSKNLVTFIVTLHPDSDVALDGQSGKHLTTIAPLAPPHRIDLHPLDWKENSSIDLVRVYLDYFRQNNHEDPIFPFTSEAIKLLTYSKDGCIRDILQRLHFTLDFALKKQVEVIDYAFLKKHQLETIGYILETRKIKSFEGAIR